MGKHTRRTFLASASLMGVAASAAALPTMDTKDKPLLSHHVFFWLKNADSKEDLNKLLEGVATLKKIKSLKMIYIGTPGPTKKREVVVDSYHISLLTFFEDVKGHDEYQEDPIHLKFVKEYGHLWDKVVIYDSMSVS